MTDETAPADGKSRSRGPVLLLSGCAVLGALLSWIAMEPPATDSGESMTVEASSSRPPTDDVGSRAIESRPVGSTPFGEENVATESVSRPVVSTSLRGSIRVRGFVAEELSFRYDLFYLGSEQLVATVDPRFLASADAKPVGSGPLPLKYDISVDRRGAYLLRLRANELPGATEILQSTADTPTTTLDVTSGIELAFGPANAGVRSVSVSGADCPIQREGEDHVARSPRPSLLPAHSQVSFDRDTVFDVTMSAPRVRLDKKLDARSRVLVIDAATELPIPSAVVTQTLVLGTDVFATRETESDATGIAPVVAQDGPTRFSARADGYSETHVLFFGPTSTTSNSTPYRLMMRRNGTFGGCTISAGVPTAGRDVLVCTPEVDATLFCGRIGDAACFDLAALHADRMQIDGDTRMVVAVLGGDRLPTELFDCEYQDILSHSARFDLGGAEGMRTVDLRAVAAETRLPIEVFSAVAEPLTLRLRRPWNSNKLRAALRSSVGEVRVLLPNSSVLSATLSAPGFNSASIQIDPSDTRRVIEVALERAQASVTARLRTIGGAPASGLEVELTAVDGIQRLREVTNEEGLASFPVPALFTGSLHCRLGPHHFPVTPLPMTVAARKEPFDIIVEPVERATLEIEGDAGSSGRSVLMWVHKVGGSEEVAYRVTPYISGAGQFVIPREPAAGTSLILLTAACCPHRIDLLSIGGGRLRVSPRPGTDCDLAAGDAPDEVASIRFMMQAAAGAPQSEMLSTVVAMAARNQRGGWDSIRLCPGIWTCALLDSRGQELARTEVAVPQSSRATINVFAARAR